MITNSNSFIVFFQQGKTLKKINIKYTKISNILEYSWIPKTSKEKKNREINSLHSCYDSQRHHDDVLTIHDDVLNLWLKGWNTKDIKEV